MTVDKVKFNNTTGFVMPIVFQNPTLMALSKKLIGITLFDHFLINGFRNAYLNDYKFPLENCVYFLFKPTEFTPRFKMLCDLLENHKEYKISYDVDGGVIFVFNIPDKYKKDVELLKLGKYSKVTEEYKKLFPQSVRDNKGNKVLFKNWMILYRHPDFKKKMEERVGQSIDENAELWDPFNPKYEIFNYDDEHVDTSW